MRDLDETDLRIIELLAEDARRSYSDIGEDVGSRGRPCRTASSDFGTRG